MSQRKRSETAQDSATDSDRQTTARTTDTERATGTLTRLHQHAGNRSVQRMADSSTVGDPPARGISDPGDASERAAERAARSVMGMRGSVVGSGQDADGPHQKADPSDTAPVSETAPHPMASVTGSGEPLDPSTRSFFERRFGTEFGDVRVHTGTGADRAARAVSAEAFTYGTDLVFRRGRYDPDRSRGKSLLAHELAHVLQQDAAGTRYLQRNATAATRQPRSLTRSLDPAELSDRELRTEIRAIRRWLGDRSASSTRAQHLREMHSALEAEYRRRNIDSSGPSKSDATAAQNGENRTTEATTGEGRDSAETPASEPALQSSQDQESDATATGGMTKVKAPDSFPAEQSEPKMSGPSGPVVTFQGHTLTPDREVVRSVLVKIAKNKGMVGVEKFHMGYQMNFGYRKTSVLGPENQTGERRQLEPVSQNDRQGGPRRRIAKIMWEEFEKLKRWRESFLKRFEARAEEKVRELLQMSERRLNREFKRYGISKEAFIERRAPRKRLRKTSAKMSRSRQAKDLAAKASGLLKRKRKLQRIQDRLETLRQAEESRYGSMIPIQEKREKLTRKQKRLQEQLKAKQKKAGEEHPLLGVERDISYLEAVAKAPSEQAGRAVGEKLMEKLQNIKTVRKGLQNGEVNVWTLRRVLRLTKREQQIQKGSLRAQLIQNNSEAAKAGEIATDVVLSAIAIGLGLLAAPGTGGSSVGAAGSTLASSGSLGISAYMAAESATEYKYGSAAANTDIEKARRISASKPSLIWVAIEIVGAGVEGLAAAKAFRKLAPLARKSIKGDEALTVLRKEGNKFDDRLGDRLVSAAKNRRSSKKAGVSPSVQSDLYPQGVEPSTKVQVSTNTEPDIYHYRGTPHYKKGGVEDVPGWKTMSAKRARQKGYRPTRAGGRKGGRNWPDDVPEKPSFDEINDRFSATPGKHLTVRRRQLRGEAQKTQRKILEQAGTEKLPATEAGNRYENLLVSKIRRESSPKYRKLSPEDRELSPGKLSPEDRELSPEDKKLLKKKLRERKSGEGRRMDYGQYLEMTISGRNADLPTSKYNQLWIDLMRNGKAKLWVPQLSDVAKKKLSKLAAAAEARVKKSVHIEVVETAPNYEPK